MREVTPRSWKRDVIPDYRDPGGLRIGLSPLSTSFDEVDRGLAAVRELLPMTPGGPRVNEHGQAIGEPGRLGAAARRRPGHAHGSLRHA